MEWTLAAVIIAELGVDMKVFASASQVACWTGVAPGNHESASKRRQVRVTQGNVHLKTALVEAAHAASHVKGTYLRDKYYRVKARRGAKRALVTVAHKILVAVYHMLNERPPTTIWRPLFGQTEQTARDAKLGPPSGAPRLLRHVATTSGGATSGLTSTVCRSMAAIFMAARNLLLHRKSRFLVATMQKDRWSFTKHAL